jgi:hypothetical protein
MAFMWPNNTLAFKVQHEYLGALTAERDQRASLIAILTKHTSPVRSEDQGLRRKKVVLALNTLTSSVEAERAQVDVLRENCDWLIRQQDQLFDILAVKILLAVLLVVRRKYRFTRRVSQRTKAHGILGMPLLNLWASRVQYHTGLKRLASKQTAKKGLFPNGTSEFVHWDAPRRRRALLAFEAVEGFADDGLDGGHFVFGKLLQFTFAPLAA